MMSVLRYHLILAILFPTFALAQSAYVCVTEMATGFKFNKATSSWGVTGFKAAQQYLVKRVAEKGITWSITVVGHQSAMAHCENDFSDQGFLLCRGYQEFRMNKKNLRFLTAYLIGYVTDATGAPVLGPEGSNTPSLEIGKCSPL